MTFDIILYYIIL